MKYVLLVSHGKFADGLKDAVEMLAGKREDLISLGLYNGLSTDEFKEKVSSTLSCLTSSDEVIVLADLIGGSPLTTTMQVLEEKEMFSNALIIGGMNLPLALTTVLMKDSLSKESFNETVIPESMSALKPLVIDNQEEEI